MILLEDMHLVASFQSFRRKNAERVCSVIIIVVTVVFPFNFDFAFILWEQSNAQSSSPSSKDAILQLGNI